MTWIKDLSAYVKPFDGEPLVLAIGWLSGSKPYPKGQLDHRVYDKLTELLAVPWELGPHFLGFHTCDLCNEPDRRSVRNLYVPGGEVLYVCPELILHYMADHEYAPPVQFCNAVLVCPLLGSESNLEAVEPICRRAHLLSWLK